MSSLERRVLLAPDSVARAAAAAVRDRRARWMLCQPRHVRRSYVQQVLRGEGDREAREQRWMLLQDDLVRHSYVSDVLGA
jgi:hypothetical protein